LRVELEENLTVPDSRGRTLGGLSRSRQMPAGQPQRAGGDTGSGGYFEKSTSAGAWLFHRFPDLLESKAFEILEASEPPKYLSFAFISNVLCVVRHRLPVLTRIRVILIVRYIPK